MKTVFLCPIKVIRFLVNHKDYTFDSLFEYYQLDHKEKDRYYIKCIVNDDDLFGLFLLKHSDLVVSIDDTTMTY